MADHARKQIRDAVATAITSLTTTGANVYKSRVYPHDTLPCLSVYTLNERVVQDLTVGSKQHRVMPLVIEARVKQNDTLDEELDKIAAEIETAITTNAPLLALLKGLELSTTDIELVGGEEEKPCGLMTLVFDVEYRVNETDPTVIIS